MGEHEMQITATARKFSQKVSLRSSKSSSSAQRARAKAAGWGLGLGLLLTASLALAADEKSVRGAAKKSGYASSAVPLAPEVRKEMTGVSWRPSCPISLDDLRLVQVRFVGFDDEVHTGELVVHHTLAKDVALIFGELFAAGFQIERMERIEQFAGSDDASMAANNTSAFNCRAISGRKGVFSRHAFGVAIDVNPQTNPFVRKGKVDPPGGEKFLDREQKAPGLIVKGDAAWTAFTARDFRWGGSWRSMKDYQHFEHKRPPRSRPTAASQP